MQSRHCIRYRIYFNMHVKNLNVRLLCKCSMNKLTNSCITVYNYIKHGGEKLKPSRDTMWLLVVSFMLCVIYMCALHMKNVSRSSYSIYVKRQTANNLFMKLIFGPVNFFSRCWVRPFRFPILTLWWWNCISNPSQQWWLCRPS